MPFVGDTFGLNSVYEKQVENVENNNIIVNQNYIVNTKYSSVSITGNIGVTTNIVSGITTLPVQLGYYVSNDNLGMGVTVIGIGTTSMTLSESSTNTSSLTSQTFVIEKRSSTSWPETKILGRTIKTSPNYGYYIGGNPVTCLIRRLDFSNETISLPGKNVSSPLASSTGTQSTLYGYYGGGYIPPSPGIRSTIARFDFSNETLSTPGNNLPVARRRTGAVSNSSYGYFGGGYATPTTYSTVVTRLDFSNETVSDPGKNLPAGRADMGTVSGPSYGYFGGGNPQTNVVTRLEFSTETVSDPGKNLPGLGIYTTRANTAGLSTPVYGYFCGGDVPGGLIATITRINFSDETLSNPGDMPGSVRYQTATQNSSNGYLGGGGSAPGASITDVIKLDFANELASLPGKNFPAGFDRGAGVSGGSSSYFSSKNYGYFAGGISICTITRLDFSTEIVSNPGKNLPSALSSLASTSNNFYGYFGGGYNNASPPYLFSTITRLDFSNETISSPGKNLPSGRNQVAATSSNSYGYFGGGGSYVSTITRLDFSNETISDPGKNLPVGRNSMTTTSSNSYGYFGGGQLPPGISTITRLDFSNETISDPGKNLPSAIRSMGGTSNNSYGYFGGGYGGFDVFFSTISRLEFSTETVSGPGKNLPSGTSATSGTSGSFYGYIAGGYTGPSFSPTSLNTITRLDFSTENVSLPGKNLPTTRNFFTGLSDSN